MNRNKGGLLAAGDLAAQDVLRPDENASTSRVATRGADFLTIGVGARAQALGGAGTAMSQGISALYWNTASTAFSEGPQIGLSYAPLYGDLDITHTFLGLILPVGETRIGLSLNTLSSGDMTATTEDYPTGGDPILGVGEATFDWTGMAVGLHLARPITDRLAVGGAAKYITEGISGADISFFAVDLSTTFNLGLFGTTLAASYVNIGSEGSVSGQRIQRQINTRDIIDSGRELNTNLDTRDVELPAGFYFGVSSELVGGADAALAPSADHRLTLAVDGVELNQSPFTPRLGAEYSFRDLVFLRAGKRWSNEEHIEDGFMDHLFSFGGGIQLPFADRGLGFDYAYTNYGQLDNVQVFSLEVNF